MQANTINTVEDTLLEFFVKHQQPLTVMEIRDECRLSETIIRKVVSASRRIRPTKKEVPIMSKECPGRVHQMRSIDAFHPSREWLAEEVQKTRTEYWYYRYEQGRGFK